MSRDLRWAPQAVGPALALLSVFTVAGATIRLLVAHDALFADELSTYWIVTQHSLPGVLSTVHSDAEITPPLFFVLSWGTTTLGAAPELVRGPSLIAGVLTIPLIYALGRRTVGRQAALVAAGFTAVAPFAIYYSAEARAYGVMMALVVGSTLALLTAVDTGRRRWWVVYAACSAGAMYSHYTCAFLLATQALWVLVRHSGARRAVLLANLGAALLFAPWATGLVADLHSPTTLILDDLSPFTATAVGQAFEHWTVGYPGSVPAGAGEFPGVLALIALALALLLGSVGAAARWRSLREGGALESRVVLVVLLALSTPVAELLISAIGTNLLGTRNLAASYPALLLLLATLLTAAPRRLRVPAVALAACFFVIGAVKLPTDATQRPDANSAVAQVERQAGPGGVVIDATGVLSPGPLTQVDVLLPDRYRVLRAVAPATRDHPFTVFDRIVPIEEAIREAVRLARGRRIWVIRTVGPARGVESEGTRARRAAGRDERFPAPYRLVEQRRYGGVLGTVVRVYATA